MCLPAPATATGPEGARVHICQWQMYLPALEGARATFAKGKCVYLN